AEPRLRVAPPCKVLCDRGRLGLTNRAPPNECFAPARPPQPGHLFVAAQPPPCGGGRAHALDLCAANPGGTCSRTATARGQIDSPDQCNDIVGRGYEAQRESRRPKVSTERRPRVLERHVAPGGSACHFGLKGSSLKRRGSAPRK